MNVMISKPILCGLIKESELLTYTMSTKQILFALNKFYEHLKHVISIEHIF